MAPTVESTEVKEPNIRDYQPITDSANVKRYIADYFADIPLMTHIAACESQNRQYDKAGNVLRGEANHSDIGVMQINEAYHRAEAEALGFDIDTIQGNVAFARSLYEKKGAKPWISSSPCWAKFTGSEIARK